MQRKLTADHLELTSWALGADPIVRLRRVYLVPIHNRSTIKIADRPVGNLPPATFGGMAVAVSPEFSIAVRNRPEVHIVALRGELDLATAGDLAKELVEIAGSTVVVDLSELAFMDSTGISALVVARNRILAEGQGRLVVTRPGGIVRKALEVVGLGGWIVEWSPDWDE